MTVNSGARQAEFSCNGVTTAWPLAFQFASVDDLVVTVVAIDGAETALTEGVDFTVAGDGMAAAATLTRTPADAAGKTLRVRRETVIEQMADYVPNDPFPAESHERALDRLTLIAQEAADDIAHIPEIDIEEQRAAAALSRQQAEAAALAADVDAAAALAAKLAAEYASGQAVSSANASALAALANHAYPNSAASAVPSGEGVGANYWVASAEDPPLSISLYTNDAGTSTQVTPPIIFPTLPGLQAVVPDLDKAKSRSNLIASTALSGYTSMILQARSGDNSSAFSDAARAFDAAATTTATSVAIGVPVDAIQATCRLLGTPAKVRTRIYERPLTSAALNTAPPNGVDDVLLSTTDLTPTECGWFPGHASKVTLVIPLSASFTPRSGYTYVIRIDSRDVSDVDLALQFSYATVSAVAQRLAGWYHATAGAGSWSNQTTTRQLCIGLSTADVIDITDVSDKVATLHTVYAAPQEASPLTAAEELCASAGARNRIKWMGGSTYNEGLAVAFGDAAWASNWGQENVDFSHTTAEGSLTAGSAYPDWDAANNRISVGTGTIANDPSGVLVQGYHILGRVITTAGNVLPLTIRDCLIEDPGPGTYIYGVQQASPYDTLVTIENCKIYGHSTRSILGGNMVIRRTYCDFTGSDIVGNAGGTLEMVIDESFFRRPSNTAFGNPDAHGDVFQGLGPLSITRSTFYMPSGLITEYDEGVVGSNNLVRLVIEAVGGKLCQDAYVLGNMLIGGSRVLDVWSRVADGVLKNFVIANNVFGGPGYSSQRDLDIRTPVGYQSNVAFYDNIRPDGSPISRDLYSSGTQTPLGTLANGVYAGVYDFVKEDMSEKFRYILGYKLGMLDPFNNLKPEYDLGTM